MLSEFVLCYTTAQYVLTGKVLTDDMYLTG